LGRNTELIARVRRAGPGLCGSPSHGGGVLESGWLRVLAAYVESKVSNLEVGLRPEDSGPGIGRGKGAGLFEVIIFVVVQIQSIVYTLSNTSIQAKLFLA
jgi:hypothetical protein